MGRFELFRHSPWALLAAYDARGADPAVDLLLADDPARRPGDVKGALMAAATPAPGHDPAAVGAGTGRTQRGGLARGE